MPTQRLHAWLDPATAVPGPPGLPRVIHDEGVALPVRTVIDMVGAGVTATDDEAGDRTIISIPGAAAPPVASVFGRIGAIVAQAGDYVVAQITGAVSTARRIIAGAGLLGGGDLSGDVTLSVDKAAVQSPWVADVTAGYSLLSARSSDFTGSVTGEPFYRAGVTIWEYDRAGAMANDINYAPRLLFYWTGVGNAQIGYDGTGIRTFAWDGSAMNNYASFKAAQIESTSGGVKFPDGTVQITAGGQTPWTQDIDANSKGLNNLGFVILKNSGYIRNTGNTYLDTGSGGSGDLIVRMGSGLQVAIQIKNNRNVGIRQTNPAYPLDVSGDINGTGNLRLPGLPSTAPAAGSKTLWYDPADGNRVKFMP